MATQKLHRLDSRNIRNSLVRADFYREIREQQAKSEWPEYLVQYSDDLKPENMAYRIYGTEYAYLKWLICLAAGMDDMRGRMTIGQKLRLPPRQWVRERIRFYMDRERNVYGY